MKANLTTGEKLQDLRKERGVTIKQVCDMIQTEYNFTLSTGKLNEMENDKPKDHGFKSFVYLAKFYNVSVDYLLGLSEIPSIPTDGKLQAAAEVTGLSSTALKALSFLYSDKELEILSALLATGNFPKILALIAAKCESIEKGNSNAIAGIINILPQKVEVFGSEFQVKPELLADSLIQTEFLRAVDSICSQYIKEENHNGKHQ